MNAESKHRAASRTCRASSMYILLLQRTCGSNQLLTILGCHPKEASRLGIRCPARSSAHLYKGRSTRTLDRPCRHQLRAPCWMSSSSTCQSVSRTSSTYSRGKVSRAAHLGDYSDKQGTYWQSCRALQLRQQSSALAVAIVAPVVSATPSKSVFARN
jgi:hypothetical protein